MSSAAPALVGDGAARAIRGLSAGAQVVLLHGRGVGGARRVDGPDGDEVAGPMSEVWRQLGTASPVAVEAGPDGSRAAWLDRLADLARLSDAADAADVPLVVASADLVTSLPSVLDLLDRPGVGTAVATVLPGAVGEGLDRLTPVRVGGDGRLVESVGTALHVVTRPGWALPGLLRVAAADRQRAAEVWRAAARADLPRSAGADPHSPPDTPDPLGLAVLAVVRAGIPVQAVPLGPFGWTRAGVSSPGAPGGPWQQRLRGAPRGGDGLVSTLMTRRLSRPLTRFGLGHGWSPNLVTVASLLTGLVAAGLVATGQRWLWVLAAVLLQVALVVDCVDGEIARFTRRFSAFGAWLDAVGDRVKEYSVCAALAVVAVRQGHEGWVLAAAAMAVVSMRHLEDFPYADRLRPVRRSHPELLPFTAARDGGAPGAPTTLPGPPSRRDRVVLAFKQVVHLPIAERYLLICLGLLTFRPRLVLWLLIGATLVSAAWTQGGRVVKALRRSDGWTAPVAEPGARRGWGLLDHQLDLGPLARVAGRLASSPLVVAVPSVLLLVAAGVTDGGFDRRSGSSPHAVLLGAQRVALLAVVLAVVGAVLLGTSVRPPVRHRLAWQLPVGLWLAEAVVVCGVAVAVLPVDHRGPAFAFLASVAYHRYDIVYRLRDTGTPPSAALALFGLGCDGRMVLLLVVAAWAPGALGAVLAVGAAYLAVLYVAESAQGWRRAVVAP